MLHQLGIWAKCPWLDRMKLSPLHISTIYSSTWDYVPQPVWKRHLKQFGLTSKDPEILIDCGPSRFAIWGPLLHQDCQHHLTVGKRILWRGQLVELLTNNSTVFCGEMFTEVWVIWMRFQCAYITLDNGIIER